MGNEPIRDVKLVIKTKRVLTRDAASFFFRAKREGKPEENELSDGARKLRSPSAWIQADGESQDVSRLSDRLRICGPCRAAVGVR